MRYKISSAIKPPIIYYSEKEVSFIAGCKWASQKLFSLTSSSLSWWKLIGLNYLVSNLMGFFSLTLFYIFVPLQSLSHPIREVISELFLFFRKWSSIPASVAKTLHKAPIEASQL